MYPLPGAVSQLSKCCPTAPNCMRVSGCCVTVLIRTCNVHLSSFPIRRLPHNAFPGSDSFPIPFQSPPLPDARVASQHTSKPAHLPASRLSPSRRLVRVRRSGEGLLTLAGPPAWAPHKVRAQGPPFEILTQHASHCARCAALRSLLLRHPHAARPCVPLADAEDSGLHWTQANKTGGGNTHQHFVLQADAKHRQ